MTGPPVDPIEHGPMTLQQYVRLSVANDWMQGRSSQTAHFAAIAVFLREREAWPFVSRVYPKTGDYGMRRYVAHCVWELRRICPRRGWSMVGR